MKKTMNRQQAIAFEMAQMLNTKPAFNMFTNDQMFADGVRYIPTEELETMTTEELKQLQSILGSSDVEYDMWLDIQDILDDRWDAEHPTWMADAMEYLNTHDITDELYSDIYKDVYGVRPRW